MLTAAIKLKSQKSHILRRAVIRCTKYKPYGGVAYGAIQHLQRYCRAKRRRCIHRRRRARAHGQIDIYKKIYGPFGDTQHLQCLQARARKRRAAAVERRQNHNDNRTEIHPKRGGQDFTVGQRVI